MVDFQGLKVNHFGPIKSTGKDYLEFKRFTVFIGDQGTGKSTLVKLFSTLTWLEKAIIAKRVYTVKLSVANIKKLFAQQNIPDKYFVENTKILYRSSFIDIDITYNSVSIKQKVLSSEIYTCPRIQYIPSERNLLSISSSLDKISGIPFMLSQFNSEFLDAKRKLKSIDFQHFVFEYDKTNDMNYVAIKRLKAKVKLEQASSGIQSIYPLLFVSRYMSKSLKESIFVKMRETDNSRRQRIINEIDNEEEKNILINYFSSGIEIKLKKLDEKLYREKYRSIVNSCFIEIIEEPEQNLFPISQVELLKNVLIDTNGKNDKLVITTHSPYVLSQLNNHVFAKKRNDEIGKVIKEIPMDLYIDYNDVAAYKIENGHTKSIMDKEYGGIDVLEIDECSQNINRVFDKLYE